MSAGMRGEQGPGLLHVGDGGRKGVVTDKKEYTEAMTDLRLWPEGGFSFLFDWVIKK